MDPSPVQGEDPPKESRPKQAACLNCRRSKVKCIRSGEQQSACEKCQQGGLECVVPDFHVGRQKGVKNKRRGLDKALYQIEEAIKKSRSSDMETNRGRSAVDLQILLHEAQNLLSQSGESAIPEDSRTPASFASSRQLHTEDGLALDDAENPLQMLARASDLQLSQQPSLPNDYASSSPVSRPSTTTHTVETRDKSDVHWFFEPIRANLDVGREIDPIELGLATMDEAEMLFGFFYKNLSHTRWGLDPLLHTFQFVRAHSAFLFTSILAASALFVPSAAALSKRLSGHRTLLARRIMANRHRSVEIVLAFMLNVPWMPPGQNSADDDTSLYMSMALSIALDLSLNKIVLPSSSFNEELFKRLARADCIDGRKALHMDGFDDIDPTSDWGRRLLRRRERTWIALFVLERGVCFARGRNSIVPKTTILENCDSWHVSDIADSRDSSIVSIAVLRRDLDGLFQRVRSSCDGYRMIDVGSDVAQSIKTTIEAFYDRWVTTWAFTIGEGEQRTLPPYVEILVIHTRLSTYSGVMNHPTAPVEVKRFFRAACLSSALNVMRAAIQGERRLKSMPNNTAIMISFAACVALSLSGISTGANSQLAPSVRNLIEETANVLERIGATPIHRGGASVLYGRHLRELVQQAAVPPLIETPYAPVLPRHGPSSTSSSLHNINHHPNSAHGLLDRDVHTITPGPATVLPEGYVAVAAMNAAATQQPLAQSHPPQFLGLGDPHATGDITHPSPSSNPATAPPTTTTGALWTEPLQFSAMSDDQIVEAVNRAGSAWDLFPTDLSFDESAVSLEWLNWGNLELGF